jgi:hydrogenase expression/formation protein HypC
MCLAIPGRIVAVVDAANQIATVDVSGVRRDVSVALLEDARVGDWVIVHTGIAIEKLDEEEARKTLALLAEMEKAAGRTAAGGGVMTSSG